MVTLLPLVLLLQVGSMRMMPDDAHTFCCRQLLLLFGSLMAGCRAGSARCRQHCTAASAQLRSQSQTSLQPRPSAAGQQQLNTRMNCGYA
jgi:hypothetical protein